MLRPLSDSDAEALSEIISDSTVQQMTTGFPSMSTAKTALDIINIRRSWERSGTGWQLGIEYESRLIGLVGLNAINKGCDRGSLDYIIAAPYRGRGFACTAVNAFIPVAAARFRLHRISASAFADNSPSLRVLEKCGFSFEGTFRHEIKKNGIYRDVAHYGLILQD